MSCYADPVVDIARARDWHVWDRRGRRYTDFCQARGAAVLGHRPRGLSTAVKNEISRGVWAPVATPWPGRIERAIRRVLAEAKVREPDRVVLVASAEEVLSAGESARLSAALWRPFCDPGESRGADFLVPVIPWPTPGLPLPVCAMNPGAGAAAARMVTVDAIAPPVGAGIVRALSLLATAIAPAKGGVLPVSLPLIDSPPGYVRNGAYFVRRGAEESLFLLRPARELQSLPEPDHRGWRDIRLRAAESGMLFPERADDPFAIPAVLSDYEREMWRRFWSDA